MNTFSQRHVKDQNMHCYGQYCQSIKQWLSLADILKEYYTFVSDKEEDNDRMKCYSTFMILHIDVMLTSFGIDFTLWIRGKCVRCTDACKTDLERIGSCNFGKQCPGIKGPI